jgi:pSer/pThr/pTyr-binding forkhead associated (FHA) protein
MGAPAGLARGRLSYVESGHPTSLVVNAGDQILVGRNANARIQLSDPKVSRQHAMLVWSGSEWLVRNLGATNGTKILGIDGAPRPLEGELRVAFGQLLVGDVLITLFPVGS